MNDSTKPAPTYRNPASLAPSVDRAWTESFILEQRLLDVPGDRIGDALVTIESHVTESGESVQEAFGDPRAYARELAESAPQPAASGPGTLTILSSFLGLVGLLLTNTAFQGWLDGSQVSLSWGHLVAFGLTLLVLLAVVGWSGRILRVITTKVWVALLALAVLIAVSVGLMMRMPEAALEGPVALFGAAGLLLLATGVLLTWFDHTADPVLAPGEAASDSNSGRLMGSLGMPIATVIVLGFTWVLHLLS